MNTKNVLRRFALGLLLGIMMCAMAVTVQGAVQKSTMISAGQICYILDKNISGNRISANQFWVRVMTSGASYDLIYAYGTGSNVQMGMEVNRKTTFTSPKTNVYLKNSASANSGALVGVRAIKGTVKLTISSVNPAGTFALKLYSQPPTNTPIRARTVKKEKNIRFLKSKGNLADFPLIFAGTKGAKITRTLSATQTEEYTFKSSYIKVVRLVNGKAVSTTKFKYDDTWVNSGNTYKTALIHLGTSGTTSGWMKVNKGKVCFMYPRLFLGVTYEMKG